jgi:hypothetical protein
MIRKGFVRYSGLFGSNRLRNIEYFLESCSKSPWVKHPLPSEAVRLSDRKAKRNAADTKNSGKLSFTFSIYFIEVNQFVILFESCSSTGSYGTARSHQSA